MVSERKRTKERQRSDSSPHGAVQQVASTAVWIPPRSKDTRHGLEVDDDDHTEVREQRGQSQEQKHHELLNSMDLIVDGQGFLIPRSCKKAADEATVDNEIGWDNDADDDSDDTDDDSEGETSTSSSSQDEGVCPYNTSLSSIPYSRLVPDGFDFSTPQTPSGHKSRNMKSISTLETEALTRTTSSSLSELFVSPRPHIKERTFLSPGGEIPMSCLIGDTKDLISPLPDPVSGGSHRRGRRTRTSADSGKVRSSYLKEDVDTIGTVYITGLTSPCGSTSESPGNSSARRSSRVKEGRKKSPVVGSPVISTSRISLVAKHMINSPPLASRSRGHSSRQAPQRHRSESFADNPNNSLVSRPRGVNRAQSDSVTKTHPQSTSHDAGRERQVKKGKERHFVPGNVDDILRPPNGMRNSFRNVQSPIKTPSSSSRETVNRSFQSLTRTSSSGSKETCLIPGISLSNRTGRASLSSIDLKSHFQHEVELVSPSSKSPSRRSGQRDNQRKDGGRLMEETIPVVDLTLDDDNDDDSKGDDLYSTQAVIVKTKKVSKKRLTSTSNRKKSSVLL